MKEDGRHPTGVSVGEKGQTWTQGHGSSTGEGHGLNPKAVVEAPRKRQQKGPR